ncbi:MAG: hypothetical protein SFV23_00495 [Planctomycetaceae bacterium]|nr:hypothetical protein [Planctomycetaceae bacterium]
MHRTLRFLALVSLAVWWGGLTVYAGIVVPVGTELFGSTAQGFVTQRVTHWLNAFAAAALGATAPLVWMSRRRWRLATWLLLAGSLAALVVVHVWLDQLVDPVRQSVPDHARFYTVHRVYLWVTSLQWLAGIVLLWDLLETPPRAVEPHPASRERQ